MPEHLVIIVDRDFLPNRVDAVVGDYVVWENRTGEVHSATRADEPAFDTGEIKPGYRSDPIKITTGGELYYATVGLGEFTGLIKVED